MAIVTTILFPPFAVVVKFFRKESGVMRVVAIVTTILDGADVVQET